MLKRAFGKMPELNEYTKRIAIPKEDFTDIPKWAETELADVFDAGIVAGTSEGVFSPDENVTDTQMDLFIKDYPSKDAFFTEMPLKDFGIAPIIEKKGNEVTLLFFGLIRDYKQLDLLIKAVNNLENPNLKVIIAGKATKEEQEKYLSLIKDKSIYELNFEFIPNENIPTIFSKADFLVLPYRSATQSGPSLIAINYSVPIIASDIVPFSDMVEDGVNGFLFESNNCEALTAVLKKVLMLNEEDISCLRRNQSKYREDYIRNNDICKLFQQFINDKILYQI